MNEALPPLPEPAAHMYPSDLEQFSRKETFAHAFSVAVGNPDERSEPLFTAEQMQAYARAALEAQAEPAGWKWVPVEPTPAMIQAACELQGYPSGTDKYRAMLAAAPQQPPQEKP